MAKKKKAPAVEAPEVVAPPEVEEVSEGVTPVDEVEAPIDPLAKPEVPVVVPGPNPVDPVTEPEAPAGPPVGPDVEDTAPLEEADYDKLEGPAESDDKAEDPLEEADYDKMEGAQGDEVPGPNYKALYDGQVALNAKASELLTAFEGQDLTVRGFIALSAEVKGLLGG